MFKILFIFLVCCCTSCCFITNAEREANYVNGQRYVPMLKTYIEKDESVKDELKDTYNLALDTWLTMLKQKYEEND